MLASFGHFVQSLSLFTAVRESALVYPILLSTHLACIATFGGLILVTNLRLLGWFLTDIPTGDLIRALRPWKQAGLAIMLTAGVLLGGSKAGEYLTNPYFEIKLLLLACLAVHGLFFRRSVYRSLGAVSPQSARLAGVLSIVLWVGVVSMGRWIAYYDRPAPPEQVSGGTLK
jgi:hypothetical protein